MITPTQIARLEKLIELKDKGALTEAEFEQQKQAVLSAETKASTMQSTIKERIIANNSDIGEFRMHLLWMILPLENYSNFTGRSGRREFWMYTLGLAVVYLILIVSIPSGYDSNPALNFLLIALVTLGTIVPSLAVQVRRLRDQDKSGWFVLLNLIPWVGALIVLILMCIEGTDGPNQYGEEALAPPI